MMKYTSNALIHVCLLSVSVLALKNVLSVSGTKKKEKLFETGQTLTCQMHITWTLNSLTASSQSSLLILAVCLCSTVLDEEKAQQEERFRMEMRRQVTVSWDAGNSDEAPPKVRSPSASAHSVTHSCEAECFLC